ncbi:hypothetical protein GCM10011611_24910 [Aliidongia dinghuensis]|uniref:Uncharacterized protein n=1 Tax=Aliidongia dinghuensis TaxID=1867774 RepID=A0A8J3E4Y6_9PROT|nr:hypothetical protein GCM10011611_24910 [Aliidongia dinghuensis]
MRDKEHPVAQGRLDCAAAAERMRALADLVRMSVEAASVSMMKDLTARAHVIEILQLLASKMGSHVEREQIKTELGLRDANLSRVMTLLAANGLVEREPRGKIAAFRVTQRGLALADSERNERQRARAEMLPAPVSAPVQSKEDALRGVFESPNIVVIMRRYDIHPKKDKLDYHFASEDRIDSSNYRLLLSATEKELVH